MFQHILEHLAGYKKNLIFILNLYEAHKNALQTA